MQKVINSFSSLGEELGIGMKKQNPDWLKKHMNKILKCPKCGGKMKYVNGTNLLICENSIEKDGNVEECGTTKFIDDKTQIFLEFIFRNL